MKDILAIAGGLIFFVSFWPYIRDIYKGKTKPDRVTWFVWALVIGIGTVAAFQAHEYKTAYYTLGGTIAAFFIFGLSLKYGVHKYGWFDKTCLVLALLSLVVWQVTNNPEVAVAFAILTDFLAALPTIRHAWLRPKEETWECFAWSVVGSTLTVLSLTNYGIVSLGYPMYVLLIDMTITFTIVLARKNHKIAL